MTFEEWAKDYFSKLPASEDTSKEYAAAKAAWETALEACKKIWIEK